MKSTLIIAAAILTIGGTSRAAASGPLLSPRAKDNQIHIVRSEAHVHGGKVDRPSTVIASPRHAEQLDSLRKVNGAGQALTGSHGAVDQRFLSPRAGEQLAQRLVSRTD